MICKKESLVVEIISCVLSCIHHQWELNIVFEFAVVGIFKGDLRFMTEFVSILVQTQPSAVKMSR